MNRNSSPYHSAGWLLNEHLEKRRGLKSIAFEGKNKKNAVPDKATYATVCKTMQHLSIINEVLNANNKKLRKAIGFDTVRNKGLLYVMLYELLFGKYQSIRGGGKIKRMIVKHEKELRREAEEYVAKNGGVGDGGDSGVTFPRYLRVNTLRCSNVSEIVEKLKEDLSSKQGSNASNKLTKDEGKKAQLTTAIYADAHVPDLLVLPPTASSWLHHEYEPVKSGKIVLQDKSSCFSALAMACGLGQHDNQECFDYIDACSAPGNKTSHLAALVHSSIGDTTGTTNEEPKKKKKKGKAASSKNNKPKSTIFAFERSSTRFNILSERMEQLVPSLDDNGNSKGVAVTPIHGDFLKADPTDPKFANVRAIMLDPSCSGSGIVNSPDRWMEDDNGADDSKKDTKRIQSLSNFQLVALKHAMSFPNVDRIVYSTCSVHDEENEVVVSKALSEVGTSNEEEDGDDNSNEWVLMAPVCLNHWARRGKEGGLGGLTKDQADCLIRCDGLDGDETNGFFVSFFVRKKLLDSSKSAARKEIDIDGIPTYNGQFVDLCKKKQTTSTLAITSEEPEKIGEGTKTSPKKQAKKSDAAASSNKPKNTVTQPNKKAADKSAKKREKKLAWKKKQALLKAERLKKKENNTSTASAVPDE